MNKEVHYEGWLIKSPPTKRIWRARWRRRWFTLKQGEIPEQFCLEYYTDRNCRKLKGVIDLDQCEQVDCGLRLENRKQKFQFMFDIKTPRRTYYLAADTEADMRDWVNCICQVCHLHDTKQSNDLQEGTQTTTSIALTTTSSTSNNTNNTTTTSLNSTDNPGASVTRQSFNNIDILRRPPVTAIEQQPQSSAATLATTYQNNEANAYVNTEYTNRETMLCDARLDRQQVAGAATAATAAVAATATAAATATVTVAATATVAAASAVNSPPPASPQSTAALYLNSPIFHMHETAARLAINSNGVVRKIPENLVLNNTPLADSQQNSVQPSPALSTASGPYIPISECFSGSPKFLVEGNTNPSTPLNNLDPKFYDTPRSHNNIGLNLTNDQSSSPKISNCGGLQQPTPSKSRSGRSDSDSESVFTDDEDWEHPMPLRDSVDRSTRPSDSSVENDSFIFTYSQRFSKLPDDIGKEQQQINTNTVFSVDPFGKLTKALKKKNNLVLDIEEHEITPKDIPQFSDTENTSPAIGPRDAKSVVDESYDIPRSHNLPYCNMGQLFEKVASPEANPIAASTPNLMSDLDNNATNSSPNGRTLPRPHCYTNAAPTKLEGNVFSYDFMEQADLPPVNRKLKPKVSLEDKPPEEVPAKPPVNLSKLKQTSITMSVDGLTNKLMASNIQTSNTSKCVGAPTTASILSPQSTSTSANTSTTAENLPMHPPSVDRKLKPNAFKLGHSATIGPSTRRSTGAPLSMVLCNENEGSYIMETRTLPRHPRPANYSMAVGSGAGAGAAIHTTGCNPMQRTALAAAAFQMGQGPLGSILLLPKNEHKLQYFDLDVSNPPPAIHRQSMSVGNLNAPVSVGVATSRYDLSADPSARAPVKSSIVYNSVDFVKTEAFKRIREEREKETEGVNTLNK